MKKKNINIQQYARLHLDGPKLAISKTVANLASALISSFTTKDQYFRVAMDEAGELFNKLLLDFGYTSKLELYDPQTHQVNPPQSHPFY